MTEWQTSTYRHDRMTNVYLSSEFPENSWNKEELQPGGKHGSHVELLSFPLFFPSPCTSNLSRGSRNESNFAIGYKIKFLIGEKLNYYIGYGAKWLSAIRIKWRLFWVYENNSGWYNYIWFPYELPNILDDISLAKSQT